MTVNPGSNTLGVLAGLGGGLFANPSPSTPRSPAQIVRVADFTGKGIPDLAVLLGPTGLSVYLGDGRGGFKPPDHLRGPPESDRADHRRHQPQRQSRPAGRQCLRRLLVLLGKGDGTFQPYHEANQAIELAVADLTGNGSKDIIYADQGLDRVVVEYGAGKSTVLADQSTGLLDPGAVQLADLTATASPT